MRARLISREHGEFAVEQEATIGRAKGCSVVLQATVVSSEHARITFDEGRSAYVLEDLGSLNGTYLDGVRLDRKEVLGSLHVIRFGDEENFVFQLLNTEPGAVAELDGELESESEAETLGLSAVGGTPDMGEVPVHLAPLGESGDSSEDTRPVQQEQEVVPVPEDLPPVSEAGRAPEVSGSAFALEFLLDDRVQRFPLKAGENVVGRAKTAEVRLEISDLSRRHATVIVTGESVWVRDEGSRNRTFVDGKRVSEETLLPLGARIVFGRLEARLLATGAESEAGDDGA